MDFIFGLGELGYTQVSVWRLRGNQYIYMFEGELNSPALRQLDWNSVEGMNGTWE